MTKTVEDSIVDFTGYLSKIQDFNIFDDLMLSVANIAPRIAKLSNEPERNSEQIEDLLLKIKEGKGVFAKKMNKLQILLGNVFNGIEKSSIGPEIKTFTSMIMDRKISAGVPQKKDRLKDYLRELQELRDEFSDIKTLTERLGGTVEEMHENLERTRSELVLAKHSDALAKKKYEKVEKAHKDLLSKYKELFENYNALLKAKASGELQDGYISEEGVQINHPLDLIPRIFFARKNLENEMKIADLNQKVADLRDKLFESLGKTSGTNDLEKIKHDAIQNAKEVAQKVMQMEIKDHQRAEIMAKALLEELEGKMDEMVKKGRKAQKKLEITDKELDNSNKELNDAKSALISMKQDLDSEKKFKEIYFPKDDTVLIKVAPALVADLSSLRNRNNDLQKHIVSLSTRLESAESQTAQLKDQLQEQKISVHALKTSLTESESSISKLRDREQNQRKRYDAMSKQISKLTESTSNSNDTIKGLQSQLEQKEAKMLKLIKLVDNLRFQNDQLKSNYHLSRTFNNPRSIDLPQKENMDLGWDATDSPDLKRGVPPSQPLEDIRNYVFLKANSAKNVSPFLYTEKNKIVVAGMGRGGSYERAPNGSFLNEKSFHFKGVYTQFDLQSLSEELIHSIDSEKTILSVLYGSPINIKLFVMHKIIDTFMRVIETSVRNQNAITLEMVVESHIGDTLHNELGEEFVIKAKAVGGMTLLTLKDISSTTIEVLKKSYFDLLSHAAPNPATIISIQALGMNEGPKRLILLASHLKRVSSPGKNFKQVLSDFVCEGRDASSSEILNFILSFGLKNMLKNFFLVLEPTKVSNYEVVYEALELNRQIEELKTIERSSMLQ